MPDVLSRARRVGHSLTPGRLPLMRRTLIVTLIVATSAVFAGPAEAKASASCTAALKYADQMIVVWDQESVINAQYEVAILAGDLQRQKDATGALRLLPVKATRDAYRAAAKRCRK